MSSNFRIKKEKVNNNSVKDSSTLEKKHKQMIKTFDTQKNSVAKLKLTLKKTEDELNKLEKLRNDNVLIDLEKRAELLNTKENLLIEIEEIENNNEEMNYYDLTGDLINKYYDLRVTNDDNKTNTKNILDYLNNKKPVKKTDTISRADLFNDYCKRIDGERIEKDDGKNRIKYCPECNVEKTLDIEQSSYICPECGLMEFVIIDEDKTIKDYSPYQRRNHFKEWLNQFQAKETTEISDEIFDNIVIELNKNRITDYSKLNRHKCKILKKLDIISCMNISHLL